MTMDLAVAVKACARLRARVPEGQRLFGRPLTLAEKVLFAHLSDDVREVPERQRSYVELYPDRVAMQDATAQMALLQFMHAGRKAAAVPTTVHCDHLIRAQTGALQDLARAFNENQEVYDFLATVSNKYGIGFWRPGAGIIHQVVLENYAFPGGLMIGTDSHTPNAGGLGMLAVGVGGADAVDVMAGLGWDLQWPGLVGVRLTGALSGWTSPKDVILKLAGILTVDGGTNRIIEYFGPGTRSISCTGKATITNMGAELGATCSVFPFDERMATYLRATERGDLAALAEGHAEWLAADRDVENRPESYFDRVVEIDLSTLEPHVVGPHTPDLARPIGRLAAEAREKGYPEDLRVALVGSCTNSSYEDIERAAHVARQAARKGLRARSRLMITPGSEQIRATIARDGQLRDLEAIGAVVLANACGPCIGQWKREDIQAEEKNSIITSFNRNFARRNDGFANTLAFIGSPEVVTAMALAGKLTFNPLTDALQNERGESVTLEAPRGEELPRRGFDRGEPGYQPPARDPEQVRVVVRPGSERLQLLEPFAPWDGKDYVDLPVLLRAKGKCTTDHISPAGPWLKYRGHLDKISDNMFTAATNAFSDAPGTGVNVFTGERGKKLPEIARDYKRRGVSWVAVGDQNYGEGSSREHAAMSPRYLGCKAVIVRSFARIHETNLKKQGILALAFADPRDYERVEAQDRVSLLDLAALAPGEPVTMRLRHADGRSDDVALKHTFTALQLGWFRAGSALNLVADQARRGLA